MSGVLAFGNKLGGKSHKLFGDIRSRPEMHVSFPEESDVVNEYVESYSIFLVNFWWWNLNITEHSEKDID